MNTFVSLCLVGSLSLGSFCYAQYMDNDAKKKVIKDLDNLLALNRSAETKVDGTSEKLLFYPPGLGSDSANLKNRNSLRH